MAAPASERQVMESSHNWFKGFIRFDRIKKVDQCIPAGFVQWSASAHVLWAKKPGSKGQPFLYCNTV